MTYQELIKLFDIPGTLREIEPHGAGYINDTYVAMFACDGLDRRVILQRINQHVFTRPHEIMRNLRLILDHCHAKIGDGSRWRMAEIVRTCSGRDYAIDDKGDVWRTLSFIEGAEAFGSVQDLDHAHECGLTLGNYLSLVSDIDTSRVYTPIKGFHVTSQYLREYDEVVDKLAHGGSHKLDDPMVREQMAFVDARRDLAVSLEQAAARGELKPRMIHGDPRINNIMIDTKTRKGVAMIDLDTSAAGLIHMDVGDAVRSICNPTGEDYQKLADIQFRNDVFAAFMGGFLAETRSFLTEADVEYLYPAIRLLPFELGLRFFTDYLNGNRYFKVPHKTQNLHRAIGQFHLCSIIESKEHDIRRVIAEA